MAILFFCCIRQQLAFCMRARRIVDFGCLAPPTVPHTLLIFFIIALATPNCASISPRSPALCPSVPRHLLSIRVMEATDTCNSFCSQHRTCIPLTIYFLPPSCHSSGAHNVITPDADTVL